MEATGDAIASFGEVHCLTPRLPLVTVRSSHDVIDVGGVIQSRHTQRSWRCMVKPSTTRYRTRQYYN